MSWPGLAGSVRRIAPLAWPVLVGQLAVLGFTTVDTLLIARHSATDLAALAVGTAIYITVFIGFMGIVLAIGPIVGQLYGARRLHEAGHELHQAIWLCGALTLLGSPLLVFPQPLLALARVAPEVDAKVRAYLLFLAGALPASLLFTAYRGFNVAVSRPKAVMALQLGSLALKLPLSAAFAYGVAALGIPAMGVAGCGLATLICMWVQVLVALWILRRDPFYKTFALRGMRLAPPRRASLGALLNSACPRARRS
jgi:multidrug resistance protein, MATE family